MHRILDTSSFVDVAFHRVMQIATALWKDITGLMPMFDQGNFSAEFSDMDG